MTYDVVIIGGGPAGLTAAIYASRARLKTLLIESAGLTVGQAVTASDIENYPGFPGGISGVELIEKFKKQAKQFGAECETAEVKSLKARSVDGKSVWQVETDKKHIESLSVIIAAGSRPRKLGTPGEDRLRGKGVSYCAVCDGALFRNKDIAVIGGGNTAVEEAVFLTKFGRRVTLIHRRNRLRATKILQERALANKKIDFLWESVVTEVAGKEKVEKLRVKNVKTGEEKDFSCDGVFVLVGEAPNTGFAKGLVGLDEKGYIITDPEMKTDKAGIFAAGDARQKTLRQVVTASGDGAQAAFSARMYVEELKGVSYK